MAGDRGLAIANGLANAGANFMQMYNQGQQRQIDNQRAEVEAAQKREYYALQMQKLKKELEPVTVDIQKVGIASKMLDAGSMDQSTYNSILKDSFENIQNPTQAAYANKILDAYQNGIQLNKAEQELVGKERGYRSSENIRAGVAQSAERIAADKRIQEANALEAKIANDQRTLELNTLKANYERQSKADEIRIKEMEAKIRDYEAVNKANNEGRKTVTDETYKKTMGDAASKNAESNRIRAEADRINAEANRTKAARSGVRSAAESSEAKSINQAILQDNKALADAMRASPGIMEDDAAQNRKIESLRASMNQKFDAYRANVGRRHPLDNRQEAAPAAPARKSGGGRAGPTTALPWAQGKSAPIGSLIKAPNGMNVIKVGPDQYEKAD